MLVLASEIGREREDVESGQAGSKTKAQIFLMKTMMEMIWLVVSFVHSSHSKGTLFIKCYYSNYFISFILNQDLIEPFLM